MAYSCGELLATATCMNTMCHIYNFVILGLRQSEMFLMKINLRGPPKTMQLQLCYKIKIYTEAKINRPNQFP